MKKKSFFTALRKKYDIVNNDIGTCLIKRHKKDTF